MRDNKEHNDRVAHSDDHLQPPDGDERESVADLFGARIADQFINEFTFPTAPPIYECRLCAGMPKRESLRDLREHVLRAHATEYALAAERRGVAFVQREGDFEAYAAMPSVDPTFGESPADDVLTPREVNAERTTTYDCAECDETSTDLVVMREHVETHHERAVEAATLYRAAHDSPKYGALPTDRELIAESYGDDDVSASRRYSCLVCEGTSTADDPYTRADLDDVRAHVAKRHVQEVAEVLARHSREVVYGTTLDDAQARAREATGFDPTRPTLADCEARDLGDNKLGYRLDDLNGANPYGESYYDRKFILPLDNAFACRLCWTAAGVQPDESNVGDLGLVRRHLVERHTDECLGLGKPGRDAGEFGAMVSDSLLKEEKGGYGCAVCVCWHAELDQMRQHVVVAHKLVYERKVAEELEHGRDELTLDIKQPGDGDASYIVTPPVHDATFVVGDLGRGEVWRCKVVDCGEVVHEGDYDRAKGMYALREHMRARHPDIPTDPTGCNPLGDWQAVEGKFKHVPPASAPPALSFDFGARRSDEHARSLPYAPMTFSTSHPDQRFEVDREALFADERKEATARRLSELTVVVVKNEAYGGTQEVHVRHERCGVTFETAVQAAEHECEAERPVPGDDLVLLRAYLTADAETRRRERLKMRDVVSRLGLCLTHVRESLDDTFEVLAEAQAALDEADRSQLDDDRARRAKLKRSPRA